MYAISSPVHNTLEQMSNINQPKRTLRPACQSSLLTRFADNFTTICITPLDIPCKLYDDTLVFLNRSL